MGFASKAEVTYEAFSIDPGHFYATRFSGGSGFNPAAVPESRQLNLEWEKYAILEEAVRVELKRQGRPIKMLDFGCGSGTFGRWLKYKIPNQLHITGIDMSVACVANALDGGYDDGITCDFAGGVPFDDGHYDFVWSMDVFGHIEFRRKDAAIAELARITKRGGRQLHGIETADVPYLTSSPADPGDAIRTYVNIDGHIGVESLDDVTERFAREFQIREAYPWLIRPFVAAGNAIEAWPEYIAALRSVDTPEARQFHDLAAHRYNRFFRKSLRAALGPIQTSAGIRQAVGDSSILRFLLDILDDGGFSFLLVERR